MIIGLSGYARSGKDSVAQILIDHFGYTRVSFGDKVKEVLYVLNPILLWDEVGYGKQEGSYTNYIPLQWVINEYGWDGAKGSGWGKHLRVMLQTFATDCCRDMIDDNIWVNLALSEANGHNIVISDVRFPNEATAIKARHGKIFKIKRPGVEAPNGHSSEHSLKDWVFDGTIYNNGDLDDLKKTILTGNF